MNPDGIRDSGFWIRIPERIPNPKSRIPRLNAIVDIETAERAGWRAIDLTRAFLDGGATFVQLRSKTASSARLLDEASAIAALVREAGAIFIVNDRADIARLGGADGVHVGQDDLAPAEVRRIVGDRAIVGLSTHTAAQMDAALRAPIDYVAIGPVFGTSTKETGYAAIGLALVRDAATRATAAGLPLVAIGGITLDRAAEVIEAGAASVAVIGDLVATRDPATRVRAYLGRLRV